MTLNQQLLALLAGTTSQNPVSTETLAKYHHRRRVDVALMGMLQAGEVCHCKITKPNQSPVDVWWLAGNAANSKCFEQAQRSNKKRAKARVEVEDDE